MICSDVELDVEGSSGGEAVTKWFVNTIDDKTFPIVTKYVSYSYTLLVALHYPPPKLIYLGPMQHMQFSTRRDGITSVRQSRMV
jgi:hypothetical protein